MPDKNSPAVITVGVYVNLLTSLVTFVANVAVGRLWPNAPKEILDFVTILVPFVTLVLYFWRGYLNRLIAVLWNFGNSLFGHVIKRIEQLNSLEIRIKNPVFPVDSQVQLKGVSVSVVIVLITTMIIIVGFGMVIRWLFAGDIHVAPEPIYGIYYQIYYFTSP